MGTILPGITLPNFNDTTPAAPSTGKNTHCQFGSTFVAPDGTSRRNDSFYMDNELVLTFGILAGGGAAGTGVTLTLRAPRAANITTCKVTITTTDPTNNFQFRIKKNGTDIFSTDPLISAATTGIVDVSSSLASSPLVVAEDDKFTFDILAGSATWALTVQLETS